MCKTASVEVASWPPTERSEKEKASMFLSYIGTVDERLNPQKVQFSFKSAFLKLFVQGPSNVWPSTSGAHLHNWIQNQCIVGSYLQLNGQYFLASGSLFLLR